MATEGELFVLIVSFTSLLCVVNAPPKTELPILVKKIEKLTMLEATNLKMRYRNKIIQSLLDDIKDPIPHPRDFEFSKKLKETIEKQLRIFKMDPPVLADQVDALEILDIPFENIFMFSKIKTLSRKEKVKNFQIAVSHIIKEHINRIHMLTKVDPINLIEDLYYLLSTLSIVVYKDSIIIPVITSITKWSDDEYQKFVVALKSAIENHIQNEPSDRFKRSKRALDSLVIPQSFFVQMMGYKQKFETNKFKPAKFMKEYRTWFYIMVLGQIESIKNV